MKRFLTMLTAAMLLLCIMTTACAMPTEHAVTHMYVKTGNGGSLNLRADQSVHSQKVASIPYGAEVMLYDVNPGDSWAWCAYNDVQGFVMTRYLSNNKPAVYNGAAPATNSNESGEYKKMEPAYYYATIRPGTPGGFVHMRWAPSKSEPVMRDYYTGQSLKVMWQDNNWCQVYDAENDVCGYMMRQFLTYAGSAN